MQGKNHEIVEMLVGELENTLEEVLESIPRAERAAPYRYKQFCWFPCSYSNFT